MKPNGSRILLRLTLLVSLVFILSATAAEAATPNPNSAVIITRVFNDCGASNLTTGNSYPALLWIEDQELWCSGFANLHIWRFSTDGVTDVGLFIAPWWAQDVDGRFNITTATGEIVCFGGRLPFYSFTTSHAIT